MDLFAAFSWFFRGFFFVFLFCSTKHLQQQQSVTRSVHTRYLRVLVSCSSMSSLLLYKYKHTNTKQRTSTYERGIVYTFFFFFFSFFFSIPFIIFALLFSLPPSRNSDPGSHSRLFSTPTRYGSCLGFFIARRFQLFLPSSTRVVTCM